MSGWDNVKKEKPQKVKKTRRKAPKGSDRTTDEGQEGIVHSSNALFTNIADCTVSDKLKVGVYGDPGSGKSHFAASFPEPIFVIDTENRFAMLNRKFT